MTSDTAKRLAEIEAREAKATPGPWECEGRHNEGEYGGGPDTSSGFTSCCVQGPNGERLFDTLNSDAAVVHEEFDEDGSADAWDEVGRRNMEFIAHARSDIPWLLAQLKAARERIGDLEKQYHEQFMIAQNYRLRSTPDWQSAYEAAERERDELKKTVARLEGRMCLICGAPEPCELDKEEMSPCTFDPSPIEAAQRFQRERDEARAALQWYASRAADIVRYNQATPHKTEAVVAVMAELELDGGNRARKALGGQS